MTLPSRMPRLAAVCFAPRRTMRSILDGPKHPAAVPIAIAAMLSFSLRDLDLQGFREAASPLGLPAVLFLSLAVVAIIALVATGIYFVISAAATAAGRMLLGGTGTYRDVRQAVGWGLAPQVWALFYRMPALLLWPDAVTMLRGGRTEIQLGALKMTPVFSPDVPLYQVVLIGCAELVFLAWYLFVGSQTLGEAQRFSSPRGLANLMLAVILPIVALLVIAAAASLAVWSSGP